MAELGAFIDFAEVKVDTMEALESVEAEDMVESKGSVVAPVRFIFLCTWMVQRLVFHRRYGSS